MGVYPVKQLILVRKDLKMKKGKIAAQASHASVSALLNCCDKSDTGFSLEFSSFPIVKEWLQGSFAKVALAVNSEDELKACYEKAKEAGFPVSYIVDNGVTVFNGVKTPTCVGIGPAPSDKLDELFGHLQLL